MKNIGNAGLTTANLIINQGCSLSFTVVHKDDNGNVIDHSGSTCNLVIKSGDGKQKIADFSSFISCGTSGIIVSIPASATKNLKPSECYVWDLIATDQHGEKTRLIYGNAKVVDTYSLDI